jgi:pectin methylesterase-like acyl-CoA thioesterase
LGGMAKFTRRIEPYAGKSANWKATLIKDEKVVFSRMVSGTFETVNKTVDRAQAKASRKKTKKKKRK